MPAAALAVILVGASCAQRPPGSATQAPERTTWPTETPVPSSTPTPEPVASPQAGTPPATFVAFRPLRGGDPVGRLMLVDTVTGDVVRVLLDNVDHSEGGIWSPELTPDRRTLYYAIGTSACTDDLRRLQLDSGEEEVLAKDDARGPAVSPDGRLLAYLRGDLCVGKDQYLVVRDLTSGSETGWRFRVDRSSGAEPVSLRRLAWLPDSRTLAYEVGHEVHLLDTQGDQGIELGKGRRLGPRDSSLELIGFHAEGLAAVRRCLIPPEPACPPGAGIVALDPHTGETAAMLLRPAPEAFAYDLDPSGRHLLYITEDGLYRWSRWESVKIGDRYLAATW
jgi:hypothetical protein